MDLRTPTVAYQADGSGHCNWKAHDQPVFGLVDIAVTFYHRAHDDVTHLAGDGCSEDTSYKGGYVYEASLKR